ncbi:MAG: dihydropteroate synthase [Candidatus Aminicenantales bacterium]
MIIVGERLNSSRKPVLDALEKKDEHFLLSEALRQEEAGAHFIDLNTAALLEEEIERLEWAIPLLQKRLKVPLSIDTPNPEAMERGLEIHKGKAILNSLSFDREKVDRLLPCVKKKKPFIIVLCLGEKGMPASAEEELTVALEMVSLLEENGVKRNEIFIDPLVHSLGVDQKAALLFLESLELIKKNVPGVKTIAGISNISFGLPKRRLLNRSFLSLALYSGLDAAILDPLDSRLREELLAAQALLGKDPGLKNFISLVRK